MKYYQAYEVWVYDGNEVAWERDFIISNRVVAYDRAYSLFLRDKTSILVLSVSSRPSETSQDAILLRLGDYHPFSLYIKPDGM